MKKTENYDKRKITLSWDVCLKKNKSVDRHNNKNANMIIRKLSNIKGYIFIILNFELE